MEERSMNFVRISRLISVVGTKVLQRLLEETAQTLFLNDLENVWLNQVQKIKNISYAAKLWGSFITDISRGDKTCRESFKPLLMSWKFPTNQVLTCPEEKSTITKWGRALEGLVSSGSSEIEEVRLVWLREIKQTLATIDIISETLNKWTPELRELCKTSRQDLLKILKKHYDDFVTSSSVEFRSWLSLSKNDLVSAINDLDCKRNKMKDNWTKESKTYFQKVERDFKHCLSSWKQIWQQDITKIPELKELLDAFETEIIAIDDTKLQNSCNTWHDELSTLFDTWLQEIDKRDTDKRSRLLKTSAETQLSRFRSIGSVCVKETLTKQLSKKQLSKLVPSSDIPSLGTTFLINFFRNYLVYPPMQGWNEVPAKSDISFGADIIRLLFFGKDIVAHTEKFRIDLHTFDKLWSDITDVLVRLASQSGDDFKSDVMNEVHEIKRRLSFNKKRELVRILEFCELAELYGKVEPPMYEKLMPSINRVKSLKRVKSRLRQERTHSSSDEGSSSDSDSSSGKSVSESNSDSGSSSGKSVSGSSDSSRD